MMSSKRPDKHGLATESYSTVDDITRRIDRITLENQELFSRLLESENRFRRLAKAVWMVQEDERRRLARDLHDGIGQMLTALKNQLERVQLETVDTPLAARIDDSVELVAMALSDTRELSRLLRPAMLDDLGLEAALRWLTRTQGKRTGIDITLDCDLGEQRLETDVETLVFRLVQEGLTNIAKHAGVQRATIELHHSETLLQLAIRDEGAGFDPGTTLSSTAEGAGSGLRGIRDRVELFGGRLELHSAPGHGTTISVSVPLASPPKAEER